MALRKGEGITSSGFFDEGQPGHEQWLMDQLDLIREKGMHRGVMLIMLNDDGNHRTMFSAASYDQEVLEIVPLAMELSAEGMRADLGKRGIRCRKR